MNNLNPGVPATFFDLPSCEEALHKEGRPGAIFFYKEGQASRGSGVFPFQVIDDSLRERVAESSGIFQQEVPRMLLWPCSRDDLTGGGDEPKRKFDLRALAFFGPGRRCWACRRFWVRVAGTSYDTGNMSREVHCTNLSVKEAAAQGEEVEALPDSSMGDLTSKVSFNLVKAMGIIASKVAGSLPTEGRYQYFGFDFILDQDLQPWVLEANSTPHLTRCNRGSCSGQVDDVLKDLIENVMEPVLGLPHGKAEIVGGVEDPKSLWNLAWDRDRFTLLMGICRALQYLHRHEPVIVHGDLKPNNIVVEIRGKKVNAKLLDFGLWRVLKHRAKPLGGTSAWAAPEVWRVKGGAPCAAADIYSFGRLIHFLATALLPAQSQSRGSNAAAAAASPAHIQQLSKAPWPADPRPFELACRAVADPCTTEDRDDRPSIEEIGGQLLSWQRRPALKHLQDPRQLMQVLSIAETAMRDPPSVDATGSLVVWDVGLQQCRESLLLAARRSGSGRRRHGRREEGSSHSVESDATAPWKPEELLGSGSSLQNHIPTPLDTRSSMLARLMERWVPTDSELGCCPFHQAALVVQDTLQDLAGFQCNKVFRFGGDYTQQCPDCLAMLGEDHTGPCDVCGHTVPGKSQFLLEAKTCLTGRMTL